MSDLHAHHQLKVDAQLGPLALRAELQIQAPWTVIFGPSGSGKSSLLRAVCGLLPRGTVVFEEHVAARWMQVQTPPHLRNLAYAPQGTVLFPHLSVRANVAFASSARRSRGEDSALVRAALEIFDLQTLAGRLPRDLSGGESQRVNLARAFAVPGARLMLLDEPFTGVDRVTRAVLLPRMREWLSERGIPVLSVTHDVEEALLLDAEVVRLTEGKVLAQGPAREVLAAERESMLQTLRDGNQSA